MEEANARAIEVIESVAGIKISSNELGVSEHAGRRWVQRWHGITNENQILDYWRSHKPQLTEEIIDKYKTATLVWKNEDSEYWFEDKDNMMFVLGSIGSPIIVTLYEEDFNWDKEANTWLVKNQIEKLHQIENRIRSLSYQTDIEDLGREINVLDTKIIS